MNWIQYVLKALSLVPYVVHGIETIHGSEKSGAEKKDLAMQALGLTEQVAEAADPEHKAAIDAAASLVSDAIDGTVAVMNAAKQVKTPVPVVPVVPVATLEAGHETMKSDPSVAPVATAVPDAILDAGQKAAGGHPSSPAQSLQTGQS